MPVSPGLKELPVTTSSSEPPVADPYPDPTLE